MDPTRTESLPAPPGPISAVVVNFDGMAHLEHCLDALFAQSLAPDEVILVDNASSDGSERLALERHPSIRLLRLAKNDGPCPARNAGLAAAKNPWVLLVDNDAVLVPDALERLAGAAREFPEGAVFQPRAVFASEPSRVHYDGAALHYVGLFSLCNFYVPLAEAERLGTVEVDGVISVALLVRRAAILDAGGFDESLFILFEDLDLSLRLRLFGEELYSVEDAIVHHRGGTPGISFRTGPRYPAQRAFFHSRNRWIVLLKNYRLRTLVLAAPGILVYEAVWLVFVIGSGALGAHLRGKWAFLRGLRRHLDARAEVQRRRRLRDSHLLVGGPLTITPGLGGSAWRRGLLKALDALLRGWWRLVRPWVD